MRRNLKSRFFLSVAIIFLAIFSMLASSCGGGGGGGGSVSFQGSGAKYHNGGGNSGWGSGNQTGGGFGGSGFSSSSSSDGLLFETVPSFFYPIDHIDVSLDINGSPAEFPGLTTSATKDVLGLSNGDKVSGTLVITLTDGTTRNATLSPTTIGIDTKLSFAVTYNYILVDSAGNETEQTGTYTSSGGIDVSSITWTRTSGANVDTVECWQAATGASYAASGIISGISGDVILTALYPELYTYTLVDGSGNASNITGTYTFANGIDVSAAASWTSDGTSSGSAISGWKSDTGTVYTPNASGKITGITGDITLTARYPLNVFTVNPTTLYRYGSSSLTSSTSYGVSGGTAPYSAVASSDAVTTTVTGTSVDISINPNYGSTLGENVADTATAIGALITITISDTAGSETDVTVRLVDCVYNNNGLRLNTANTTAANLTSITNIPTNGIVNGVQLDDYIANDAFTGNTTLTTLTLPSNITTISAGTFSITDPANSTGAFSGSSITTLTAPGLTSIREAAFANSQITTITTGNVTTIGSGAFANCANLASADLSHISSGNFSQYAFYGCSALTSVTWSSGGYTYGQANIPAHAFENSGVTDSVISSLPVAPTGYVFSISNYAFADCTGLTNITIPDGINNIGDFAFNGCTGLTQLTLPNSNCTIGTYCFAGCSSLTTITAQYNTFEPSGATGGNFYISNFIGLTSLHELDLRACSTVSLPSKIFESTVGNIIIEVSTSLTSFTLTNSGGSFGDNPIFQFSGTFTQWQNVSTHLPANWGGRDIVVYCQADGVAYRWEDDTSTWSNTP